jgi:hypothetical protein
MYARAFAPHDGIFWVWALAGPPYNEIMFIINAAGWVCQEGL